MFLLAAPQFVSMSISLVHLQTISGVKSEAGANPDCGVAGGAATWCQSWAPYPPAAEIKLSATRSFFLL